MRIQMTPKELRCLLAVADALKGFNDVDLQPITQAVRFYDGYNNVLIEYDNGLALVVFEDATKCEKDVDTAPAEE